jgi:hypothetical protein
MGDDEARDGELRERGVDRPLVLQVEVRSALVQDQDPGAPIERAGDQHPLLLAPGECRTHVPDQALVAHRHAFDVGFDLGEVGADAHELHVGLLIEARDVLGDGALQQAVVLSDEGDLAAQGLRVPAAERLAVDADVAIAGFVEPGDELEVLCV